MKKSFNKKIVEVIESQNLKPKSQKYFLIKEISLWSGTIMALLLAAISAGSFIFQIYNYMLLPPRLSFYFGLLRVVIIGISITFALYQILNTQKGYKRKKTTYLIIGFFIVFLFGSLLFFSNLSGLVEKKIGKSGFINHSIEYWSQPESGVLSGELQEVTNDGYFLIKDFQDNLHIVDIQNIPEQQQDIFIDFLRIKMIGYAQGELFYPCAVAPWELRGAASEKDTQYGDTKKGNIQFSKGKRNQANFQKLFERKNDIVRTNTC